MVSYQHRLSGKKIFRSVILFLLLPFSGYAQDSNLDAVMREIQYEQDTLKSVFDWIANNIVYDVDLINTNRSYTSQDEIIAEVLQKRSGVCQHYAELFHAILEKLGYQSYVVTGYTRQNKLINDELSHAWNAVKLKGSWYLFDPTWSAGYVHEEKFFRKYDDVWYKADPEEFIYTHIPFDPLWQLMDAPLAHTEIRDNHYPIKAEGDADFEDEIRRYLQQDVAEQLASSLERIKASGITNRLIQQRVDELKNQAAILEHNQQVAHMNKGVALLNTAVADYNTYVHAKNRRFKNPKWSDEKLRAIADSLHVKVHAAYQIFNATVAINSEFHHQLAQNKKVTEEVMSNIARETAFIERYLKTWKPLRIFTFR